MSLVDIHRQAGAQLAADGIPLHYGDLASEYQAALESGVLLDRSHEGRLKIHGADCVDFLHRMSTNDLTQMAADEGRPTIFTNANGRILDRLVIYNREDHLLGITEPTRAAPLASYLQRHIFFNDNVQVQNITGESAQFALHGPQVANFIKHIWPQAADLGVFQGMAVELDGVPIYLAQRKPLVGTHWVMIMAQQAATQVWQALLQAGEQQSIQPSGSLLYHILRVRAGRPAAGSELQRDYIPLELGLWDEVSFSKGCYTGQEIIARMESRGKLAKCLMHITIQQSIETPAPIFHEGREIGTLTSCAQAPDGTVFALGVIKTAFAKPNLAVTIGEQQIAATIEKYAGIQRIQTDNV